MAKLDGLNDLALTFADPPWAAALQSVGVQGFQSGSIRAQLEALPAQINGLLEPLCNLVGVPFDPNDTVVDTLDAIYTATDAVITTLNAAQALLTPDVPTTTLVTATQAMNAACTATRDDANTLRLTAGGLPGTLKTSDSLTYVQNQVGGSMPFLDDALNALGATVPVDLYGRVVNVRGPVVVFYNKPISGPAGTARQWGQGDPQFVSAFGVQYPGQTPLTGTFAEFQAVLVSGNWS